MVDEPMNIAIDVSTTAGFRTGTEEYIEGLVYGLRRVGVQVVGVGRQTSALLPDKPHLGLDLRRPASPLQKWWWEFYGVRRVPKDVELLHIPFMAHPEMKLAVPTVVTVHDLIPYRLETYRKNFREHRYFAHVARALLFADRLVTISQATLQDLKELFPDLARRAVTIPNGVHPDFFSEIPATAIGQASRRFGLRRHPRILYAGGYDERKNVGTLLEAVKIAFDTRHDGELVLVGAKDNLYVRRKAAELGIEGRLVVTPFVSREDLVALYNCADLFVYPSRFEGFGLPPAQALAVGVPVVASDIAPHREVVQNYGELVDAGSVEAWAEAIGRGMDLPAAWVRRVEEGQAYAERFSWSAIAEEYMAVYRDTIAGRHP